MSNTTYPGIAPDQTIRDYFMQTIEMKDRKEQFLMDMLKILGVTEEQFIQDWLIEVYPIRIDIQPSFEDSDEFDDTHHFVVQEQFRVRLKTFEEKEDELSAVDAYYLDIKTPIED